MQQLVRRQVAGPITRLVMDDGKANVMSVPMLRALHAALDDAEREKAIVILTGREGIFSAGFDLKVFANGTAEEIHEMMRLGSELALRLLTFPTPVVVACNGHAFPEGAFLMLASDVRVGADGPFKIGLNEVAIGLTVPSFAIELARFRLAPAYFNRTVMTGEMFLPRDAQTAGFLDHVVASDALAGEAEAVARKLAAIDLGAHAATKERARGAVARAVRAAIDAEITLEVYKEKVARRPSQPLVRPAAPRATWG